MENTNKSGTMNNQTYEEAIKQIASQNNIFMIKWDQFNSFKDKDSSNKYYSLNENKSITENIFFQSKSNSNYVFISKYL